MKEIYETLFNSFVGDNDLKPELKNPFIRNDVYYASDANSMVFMDKKVCELSFKTTINLEVEKVVPKKHEETICFNYKDVVSQIDKEIKLVDKMIKVTCPACDGDGGQECNLDFWHECGNCFGRGHIKKPLGGKENDPDVIIKIESSIISYHIFKKLLLAAEVLNADSFTLLSHVDTKKPILFGVGDVFVLLMPVLSQNPEQQVIELKGELKR